jgi:hypothetical protein
MLLLSSLSGISPRSLPSDIAFSPPQYGFFAKVFKVLGQLCLLQALTAKLSGIHKILDAHHRKGCKRKGAFNQRAKDYAQEVKRGILLATENPELFARKFILSERKGSPERQVMTGILKEFQPDYYLAHVDTLGDCIQWHHE